MGSTTSSYSYAANANQITTITNTVTPPSAGNTGSYFYNAFRQRVQKVAGSATTQFVYDQAGHLIAEANGSGTVQKEYIWLDDMPVAMIDSTGASPALYFIHTDQLGTPQKLTDGSMNVVWDGVFDPFGNPASGASLALTNLRFPGQYFDAEVALNQNWNRDYDPTTGRYIQSDPIGLKGGNNTYAYVWSNPLNRIDPYGFWQITVSGGAEAGGAVTFGYNSGQWNIGAWAGAGAGLSVRFNPLDQGCKPTGIQTGFRGQANWNLLGRGGGLGIQVGKDIIVNGSFTLAPGVSLSTSVNGTPSTRGAPLSAPQVQPTLGAGSSAYFGWGGTVTW